MAYFLHEFWQLIAKVLVPTQHYWNIVGGKYCFEECTMGKNHKGLKFSGYHNNNMDMNFISSAGF